eukprot:GHVH01010788.1.p2 GENE.GHVH01010788.1~~GHVH01010788.1.p2  ORF type:complete len:351 (-),score=61.33 GHVH01010788.1:642-1694(-)
MFIDLLLIDEVHYSQPWNVDPVSGLPHEDSMSLADSNAPPVRLSPCLSRYANRIKSLPIDAFEIHIKTLILSHPGMDFLWENAPFVHRFMITIKYRLEFRLNDSSESRVITLDSLRSTSIAMVWHSLESMPELISCRQFFGYESFYVVFFKFHELRHEHASPDTYITENDFHKYDGHGMLQKAVARLFDPGFSFLEEPGRMNYREFLNFLWMDEDKATVKSIVFWFRFFDLNGDGKVTSHELEYFFTEQFLRYESIMQESLTYSDMLCQLNDLMMPQIHGEFSLRDFIKHPKLVAILIDQLISMSKTLRIESKDPYATLNDLDEHPFDNDWDRFIRNEYETLSGTDNYSG